MPVIPCEFEVYCSCGQGLCNNSTEGTNRHSHYITIEPCQKCLDSKYEEGHSDGFDEARRKFEEI